VAAGVAALGASVVAAAAPVVVLVAPAVVLVAPVVVLVAPVVVEALAPVLTTALVSVNSDAPPGRVVAEGAPAAADCSGRCTQPVTIMIAGLL
jgi:hypothetical protein